ncbi:MAG: DNA alkylation repair protein [Bacteroidota bacterium]
MALPTAEYHKIIGAHFAESGKPEVAEAQAKYMRHQFQFYGLKSPERRLITKSIFQEIGWPTVEQLPEFVEMAWAADYRDWQMLGLDLMEKYIKKVPKDFIFLLEKLIITKSWWDTVDMLAGKLVARHFQRFPEMIPKFPNGWMDSNNIWLQRSALIFQLKYRDQTNVQLLFDYILKLKDSDEFFIQKAAGWALREYSKRDWQIVLDFMDENNLPPLTKREGLKWMKSKGVL